MPKFVAFVFKVIFGVIIIATFTTLFTSIFDIFITTRRIQNLANIVQMDIAENNCMLNDMYTSYVAEVSDICNRSVNRSARVVGTGGELNPDTPLVEVYLDKVTPTGANGKQMCIQTEAAAKGSSDDSVVATSATQFRVANYGDILVFKTNLSAQVGFMFFQPTDRVYDDNGIFRRNTDGSSQLGSDTDVNTLKNYDYLYYPPISYTLTYKIPALTYLK